jgi:hypothetical protein
MIMIQSEIKEGSFFRVIEGRVAFWKEWTHPEKM